MAALDVTNPRVLAIIPARGGSRGVPGKNIREVGGRPLIAWTIDAARAALSVDRVVVSTDSHDIADVARRFGAEVPLMRPSELARDDTPGVAPAVHMARSLEQADGYRPDLVVLLQPTSPLRNAQDIDEAIALAGRTGADSVVSVCPAAQHPAWMKRIGVAGELLDLAAPDEATIRQQLPAVFVLNGAIYLARTPLMIETRSFYGRDTRAYVMPPQRSLDIDTAWDLHLADLALRFPFSQ